MITSKITMFTKQTFSTSIILKHFENLKNFSIKMWANDLKLFRLLNLKLFLDFGLAVAFGLSQPYNFEWKSTLTDNFNLKT